MFNRWFQGRYGVDQLSRALIIASLIVSVISWFFGRAPAGVYYALRGITLALIAFALFRMLSRNFYARQQELAVRRAELLDIQKELQKTILLVTHQLDEALLLAQKIVVLHADSSVRVWELELPYPRDLTSPQLTALREEITAECRKD